MTKSVSENKVFIMIEITNVVVQAKLNVNIDLKQFIHCIRDAKYNPAKFSAIVWHHRKIGGSCLLFNNGHIICHGSKSMDMARQRVRKYARVIQKFGYVVNLKYIKLVTASAVVSIGQRLDLPGIAAMTVGLWEPELFNGLNFYKGKMHFSCFSTGKVVITGITSFKLIETVIYPAILELQMA